jgi:hypothetical protein
LPNQLPRFLQGAICGLPLVCLSLLPGDAFWVTLQLLLLFPLLVLLREVHQVAVEQLKLGLLQEARMEKLVSEQG